MKKYILLILTAFALTSCNLDFFPYDKVSSGSMQNVENAGIATDGNYALFKAALDYGGFFTVGNTYVRHYFQLNEYKGDNTLMSGKSTDPLFLDATLDDSASDTNTEYFWFVSYKICYATSVLINMIPDDTDDAELRHIKGENLTMRAFAHMGLCQVFANPYVWDEGSSPGVIINTGESGTTRATVKQVYDRVEADLKEAIACMDGGTRRGNNGYICKATAQGLLARLYLYEGRDQDCINMVDEMLAGADPSSMLDPDYEHLFQFSKESKEVLWCIGLIDNTTDIAGESAVLGSMYWCQGDPGDGSGWAEIYWSQPLIDLFERYPGDQRIATMRDQMHKSKTGAQMIYWPIPTGDAFYENNIDRDPVYDATTGKWTCKEIWFEDKTTVDKDGNEQVESIEHSMKHTVETELVNGYKKYWITKRDGEKQYVTVTDSMGCRIGGGGNVYPLNYMKKFSCQEGKLTNLGSPAVIRWAELILDRAEAYAHLGQDQKALDDVNVIRKRAGLADEAMFSTGNYAERGYASVLDVVLDERRLELCFEGFRVFDLQRNKKQLDRRYAGRQPWEVLEYNDTRLKYQIPVKEILVTGIEQNPR